ncbi:unnamed protein product [Moneuplotes crassus]|uniref:Uncharacterized protein n=1 Tax=Euplotes crassus TaxID=5936 RepID=A0AAD1XST2_EUPCR|nr:unnamed protein product [Moneuplotes crassus]
MESKAPTQAIGPTHQKIESSASSLLENDILKEEVANSEICMDALGSKSESINFIESCHLNKFVFDDSKSSKVISPYAKLKPLSRYSSKLNTYVYKNKNYSKLVSRFLEVHKNVQEIEEWELYILGSVPCKIQNMGLNNVLAGLSKITKCVEFGKLKIGPTHLQKIIVCGRHLKGICFNRCMISEQQWSSTFKNYYPSPVNLNNIIFLRCYSRIQVENDYIRFIPDIMKGILDSSFRNLINTIEFNHSTMNLPKEALLEALECKAEGFDIILEGYKILFVLGS